MARDTEHALQPRTDHDGISRRLAVLALKGAVRGPLQARLKADVVAGDGVDADAARSRTSYRLWSGVNRASQDRMWQILSEQIDADFGRIAAAADAAVGASAGSLSIGEVDEVPDYERQTPIHGQPGGYMLERDDRDIAAGILYEAGGNLYAMGQGIGKRDSKGERLIRYVRDTWPDLKPQRILEMGCSAGAQSTDYPAAFPDAEFHAIDLSPGMLRYAHARAELLGSAVHFHQQDAGNTKFPDGYFDLIVSHNLFHETAASHMPAIAKESFRLLRPGGVCLHQDVPIQSERLDAFQRFVSEWQKDHNDEPFWTDFANADLPGLLVDAGFPSDRVKAHYLKALDGPIPWYVVEAVR
ncbi:MAG: class I SAM-dependent methyltransferase [Woeseiaceae bacterium]|nr:class I SAM-dependent methyltransferase [Woeseiaceae bacterium]